MTSELLPRHAVRWTEGPATFRQSPNPHPAESELRPIAIIGEVEFAIVAPARQVCDLLVMMATFARTNSVPVRCVLLDDRGDALAQTVTEPHLIRDNAETPVLDLSGVELVPGRVYKVRLTSPGATRLNSFAIYGWMVSPGRYELHRRLDHFTPTRLFAPEHESASTEASPALVVSTFDKALRSTVERFFPGESFAVVTLEETASAWQVLRDAKYVVFVDIYDLRVGPVSFDDLCFALHRVAVPTVFLRSAETSPATSRLAVSRGLAHVERQRQLQAERCRFVLTEDDCPTLYDTWTNTRIALAADGGVAETTAHVLAVARPEWTPHVAIVSVLYRKSDIIERFLDTIVAQTYGGRITTILVDDCSPENDAAIAADYAALLSALRRDNRDIQIIRNTGNLGNCASRLAGLASVTADIYIIIDCDCLLNSDFVAAHVFEHARDDVDVVIGPLNIETWDRNPFDVISDLTRTPTRIGEESDPQDPIQDDGFLNCITRNFSIKRRRVLEEPLFDLDFSYSSKPDSGFGWEDVEMGYRLYAKGAIIRHTSLAISVHCTHPSSVSETQKIRGSMRNFARLFEKHPDLALAGRRWATDTYAKLVAWGERENERGGTSRAALDALFADEVVRQAPLRRALAKGSRRLRILTYRWHAAHQYELYKLPHEFTLVTGLGNPMSDEWAFDQRPLRSNVRMFHKDVIDPRNYDLAILHFDENILATNLCNGTIPSVWGDPFRWLLGIKDIPKVAICHGTLQFEGQYGLDPLRKDQFVVHEAERQRLVGVLGEAGVNVVCNSHQAHTEWQFKNSRVIWHGFDPQQFPPGDYTRDVLALNADFHRPHYRGAWEHLEVEKRLVTGIKIESANHAGAPGEIRGSNAFAERQFRAYIDRIRQFSCYLNTTLRSPMPRSRGEAMMSGVVPICLRNHDVDLFIDNRVDGFYGDAPEELAAYINYLLEDRDRVRKMGAAARRKAMDVFNHDRYLTAWCELIEDTIGQRL